MSAIEYQKIFLKSDGTVAIKCPACMFEKFAPYEKLPPKFMFQVRCKCGALFDVQYELRKKYRKDVDLEGIILKVVQDERWGKTLNESLVTKIKPVNCRVRNISQKGAGLTIAYGINLNVNDLIILRFTLDNSASSQIEKKAIVRSVKKNYAGCEFFGVDDYDRTIKFYLL